MVAQTLLIAQEVHDLAAIVKVAALLGSISKSDVQTVISDLIAIGLLKPDDDTEEEWEGAKADQSLREMGWCAAADYIATTRSHRFVYPAKVNNAVANERMQLYAAENPDVYRPKVMEAALVVEDLQHTLTSSEPPCSPRDALLKVLGLSLCATGEVQVAWADEPLVLRTSPSGGSRHPVEGYLWVFDWPGIDEGLYHIQTKPGALRFLGTCEDFTELPTETFARCSFRVRAIIQLTTVFERNMWRYRDPRTLRSVLIDTGHVASTVMMAAQAAGFATSMTNSLDENIWLKLLDLEPLEEAPQVSIALGLDVTKPDKTSLKGTSK